MLYNANIGHKGSSSELNLIQVLNMIKNSVVTYTQNSP